MSRTLGPTCPRCGKPPEVCVCDLAQPRPSRHEVLVLQHPQESRQPLSSTPLIPLVLARATVKVGLSWPNLRAALGHDEGVIAARWGVLYLGAKKGASAPAVTSGAPPLAFVDKQGARAPRVELDGIVLIDGTWSQAKTIWWRNACVSRLRRLVLTPTRTSRYGDLRLAARTEGLSTLEAAAETLRALGEAPELPARLERLFETFLARWSKRGA